MADRGRLLLGLLGGLAASVATCLGLQIAPLSPERLFLICVTIAVAANLVVAPRYLILSFVPAAFVTLRVAGGLLSVSDVVLIASLPFAFATLLTCDPPLLRKLLFIPASYAAILVIVVAAHPTPHAVFELFRRTYLVTGGLAAGSALALLGSTESCLRALRWFGLLFSGIATLHYIGSGGPYSPLGMEKNTVGGLIAVALVVSVATDTRRVPRVLVWIVMAAGLLGVGSRGAILGAAAGVLVVLLADRDRSKIVKAAGLAAALVVSAYAISNAAAESHGPVPTKDTSTGSRENFTEVALAFWRQSPILGQGLRFFEDPAYNFPVAPTEDATAPTVRNPHNLVTEALSESGLVGLGALIVLNGTGLILLWSRRPSALAAVGAFAATTVHSAVDIYWLAGQTPLPWLLAGIAIVDRAATETHPRKATDSARV